MKKPTPIPQFEVSQPLLKSSRQPQKGYQAAPKIMGGAGNGDRTRDTKLGKLVLYQLSYARS
jgi:hypothetical protein